MCSRKAHEWLQRKLQDMPNGNMLLTWDIYTTPTSCHSESRGLDLQSHDVSITHTHTHTQTACATQTFLPLYNLQEGDQGVVQSKHASKIEHHMNEIHERSTKSWLVDYLSNAHTLTWTNSKTQWMEASFMALRFAISCLWRHRYCLNRSQGLTRLWCCNLRDMTC